MLNSPNLKLPFRNPNLLCVRTSPNLSQSLLSNRLSRFFIRSLMASSKIVAEYAKSSRSSCKKCSKAISANTLRLGLVSRDARGFDMTKWHHFDCFPTDSQPIVSVEKINGFLSLESSDQEALKKLVEGCHESPKEGCDGGSEEKSLKESKARKADETGIDKLEESNSKKYKPSTSNKEDELKIAFSSSNLSDKYKDATLLPKWKAFQTIIFLERDEGLHDSRKIAAFDFDGCLAKTSVNRNKENSAVGSNFADSANVTKDDSFKTGGYMLYVLKSAHHPTKWIDNLILLLQHRTGADAWSLLYPSIPEKLKSLYNDGYKLVIFTNESNIERWKNKRQKAVDSKIGRLNNFIKCVEVPIQVFIACGLGKTIDQTDDIFRKPKTGMWRIMEQQFNSGITIDMDQSFYVGDAAGRSDDHSDADIKFAQAIGLKFYVPEEYFGA